MSTRELPTDDLYAELGVPENASFDLIDQRFRALAKLFHPDRNPGDADAEARFKRITAANRVLGDPQRRAAYDATRHVRIDPFVPRRPAAAPPRVQSGKGMRRRVYPRWVRWSIATVLIVSGLAVMAWRVVANDGMDGATDVTMWVAGIKLLIVGLIAAALPGIRRIWDAMARQ